LTLFLSEARKAQLGGDDGAGIWHVGACRAAPAARLRIAGRRAGKQRGGDGKA